MRIKSNKKREDDEGRQKMTGKIAFAIRNLAHDEEYQELNKEIKNIKSITTQLLDLLPLLLLASSTVAQTDKLCLLWIR